MRRLSCHCWRRPSIKDLRETLVAYIEGTLSSDERAEVQRRLQCSAVWQREFAKIEHMQSELKQHMPLIGYHNTAKLDALLPDILQEAAAPTPRRYYWWKGAQIILVMSCVFGVLLMVPIVLQSASAEAQDSWSPNAPVSTSTPGLGSIFMVANETEEPPPVQEKFSLLRQQSVVAVQRLPVHCEASPVPMPDATQAP